MEYIIALLILTIGCLLIRNYRLNQKYKLYYSNYQNAMLVVGQYDPKLKEYMDKRSGIK